MIIFIIFSISQSKNYSIQDGGNPLNEINHLQDDIFMVISNDSFDTLFDFLHSLCIIPDKKCSPK